MAWVSAMVCEACWMKENFKAGDSDDKFDYEFRKPILVNPDLEDDEVSFCAKCGEPTISGIYQRMEI